MAKTKFTQKLSDDICERISDGQSVREITRDESMPAMSTVFRWLADKDDFREQYARACTARAEHIFDEMLDIADDGDNDWMERKGRDNQSIGWQENGEALGRSKIRIDARKWVLGKMNPKKYGEKVTNELVGKDGGPIETFDYSGLSDSAIAELMALRGKKD